MNKMNLKSKLFIIITLVLVVVGMVLFVVGPNQTVDYSNSYEVRVSINQKTAEEVATLKTATNEYLDTNGIKTAEYAYQELDDGKVLIFKFNDQVPEKIDGLKDYVQSKFTVDTLKVTVEVSEVVTNDNYLSGWVFAGLGIATVAIFLYALIMEKLSGAVATLISSLFSAVLFVALINITRIPAYPFLGAGIGFALALGAGLSVSTANRLKEEYKMADGADAFAVADKVMSFEKNKYLFTLIVLLIGAVALIALFLPYLMIIGGQIAIAGVSALAISYFATPLVWASIKGAKK